MHVKYKIIYTITDESPALSSFSFLPIILVFINKYTDITIETCNISLSHRILGNFPEKLNNTQKVHNSLLYLRDVIHTSNANIIKLPNISASLPQLNTAIIELQNQGYNIPNYINNPSTHWEHEIKYRYNKIQGSSVNPILRAGNSHRYIPLMIKQYVKNNCLINVSKPWSHTSKTHVSSMKNKDFYDTEKSVLINTQNEIKIVLIKKNGIQQILKKNIMVNKNDVIDASMMSKKELIKFINQEIENTKKQNILLSIHLKASMMKISDPIIFGIIVKEFYKKILSIYNTHIKKLKINFNNGISEFYKKINCLPSHIKFSIYKDMEILHANQPKLAMVDYIKKFTNLHTPTGMIIDSSMAIMIKNAGKMRDINGKYHDTNAIIPDRCYSNIYKVIIENCKKYGSFNPQIMGSVSNIGLMEGAAEEYGSHNNTFQIPDDGYIMQVIDRNDQILIKHFVEPGDIWRLCYTSHQSIQNWIQLGIQETIKSDTPAIFWLDPKRAHDTCLIKKVKFYLETFHSNIKKSHIQIMEPENAMLTSINYIRNGKNVISITGNVLRDYLTDLFPIIELGTSSNMLSIINLTAGGKLFETGSGGSAPKHMQQFIRENHLKWNSLGEFLALSASLKYVAISKNYNIAKVLYQSLNIAIKTLLEHHKLPVKEVGQLDTRGSHFYLALYWSAALSSQVTNEILRKKFLKLTHALLTHEDKIIQELSNVQGKSVNIGGYYHPDIKETEKIMRPSTTFNTIINDYQKMME